MANGTCLVIIYYKNLYFWLSVLSQAKTNVTHDNRPILAGGFMTCDSWTFQKKWYSITDLHKLFEFIWIIFQNLPNLCKVRDTDLYFSLIFIIQDHFQTYIYHNPFIWCIPIYLNYYSLILIFIIMKYKIICSHWFQWLYLFYNVIASLTHNNLKYYLLWF